MIGKYNIYNLLEVVLSPLLFVIAIILWVPVYLVISVYKIVDIINEYYLPENHKLLAKYYKQKQNK